MKPLAIIPARAGSRRLPGKNLERIGEMTLIGHAVEQANKSGVFGDHVWVNTDIDRGSWFQWSCNMMIRPQEIATDSTPMLDVVRWHLAQPEVSKFIDTVVLLQPTSPLRTADDIQRALAAMEQTKADALVSVVEQRNPELYTIGHAGRLRPVTRHMDGRRLVVPNGAIYAVRASVLGAGLDWWTAEQVYAYEMPPERSVDIDTAEDLELARKLWTAQN